MGTQTPLEIVIGMVGSRAELARKLNVTRSFITRIAEGKAPIPPAMCRQIEYLVEGAVTAEELRPDVFKLSYRHQEMIGNG